MSRSSMRSARLGSAMSGLSLVLFCSFLALGCSKQPPAEQPSASTEEPAPETMPGKDPGQATIKINPTIAEACGISDTETYFGYNSSKVGGNVDATLQKLATCFATGPLAGKTMSLVGHTDPRGEDEYNMTLGGRRADNVKAAIASKGLSDSQMQTTSRGEMEATGSDESSWSKDRKVEINLVD